MLSYPLRARRGMRPKATSSQKKNQVNAYDSPSIKTIKKSRLTPTKNQETVLSSSNPFLLMLSLRFSFRSSPRAIFIMPEKESIVCIELRYFN